MNGVVEDGGWRLEKVNGGPHALFLKLASTMSCWGMTFLKSDYSPGDLNFDP